MIAREVDPESAQARATLAAQQSKQTAAATATQNAAYQTAAQKVQGDLNSDNYAQAWKDAEAVSNGTTDQSATTNPVLGALETQSGLQALDPTKKWTQADLTNYYTAAMQPSNWNAATTLGKNPYGTTLWGSNATGKAAADAATNESTDPNGAPDLARFAGAQPTTSFLSKYGADIAALVATVATAGAGAPLAAAALAGSGAQIAANAAAGHPTTWKSAGTSLAAGQLGAAVPGIGSAIDGATGIGATASDAIAGAGTGALRSEISGGNPLTGAVTGGLSGGITGSGIKGDATNALTSNGVNSTIAGGLVNGATGAGLGALGAELNGKNVGTGALTGGVAGTTAGAIGAATGNQAIGNLSGTIAGNLVSRYGTSPTATGVTTPTSAPKMSVGTVTQPTTQPTAQPTAQSTTPGISTASNGMMSLTPATQAAAQPAATNYNGLGYTPRQQTDTSGINYSTYGQGPEFQFFKPST